MVEVAVSQVYLGWSGQEQNQYHTGKPRDTGHILCTNTTKPSKMTEKYKDDFQCQKQNCLLYLLDRVCPLSL